MRHPMVSAALWLVLILGTTGGTLACQEWSDITSIQGKYSRIYFDYQVSGSVGTFYCINDWMTNQDDGGVEGGLHEAEYNRFAFQAGSNNYEIRIFRNGTYELRKDGIADPFALQNFQSATGWNTSPNDTTNAHTIWEFKFEIPSTYTMVTTFMGHDPAGPVVVVTPHPAPMPSIVTTGPSAYPHYIDGQFADAQAPPLLPPVPSRAIQEPVRDPWFEDHDNGWAIAFAQGGGLHLVTIPVADAPEPAVPKTEFDLRQNQPNPFAAGTSIGFALPHDGQINLGVADVSGRLIRILANDHLAMGEHVYRWDGTIDAGGRAASGIYFYRLRWDGKDVTRRMVLLE